MMNKLYKIVANQKREGETEEKFLLSEGLNLDINSLSRMRSSNLLVEREDDRIEKSLGETV